MVFIPEPQDLSFKLETEKRHVLTLRLPKRKIRVRVLDANGTPFANQPFEIAAGDKHYKGQSDGDGVVEQKLSAAIDQAALTIGGLSFSLAVGHLNPTADAPDKGGSGIQARLRNLGYCPGPIDGVVGPKTRAALRCFQTDEGLVADGKPTQETLAALIDRHGC